MRAIEIFAIIDSIVACILGVVIFKINYKYKDRFSRLLTYLGIGCYLAGGFFAVLWILRVLY